MKEKPASSLKLFFELSGKGTTSVVPLRASKRNALQRLTLAAGDRAEFFNRVIEKEYEDYPKVVKDLMDRQAGALARSSRMDR